MTDKMTTQRKGKWTDGQTEALVDGYLKNKRQLAGHFSATLTHAKKEGVWLEMVERVNSTGVVQRSVDECKKKWADVKSATKKKERLRRREARLTGGGPAPEPLKIWEEKIVSVLSESVLDGIEGGVDTMDLENGGVPVPMKVGSSAEVSITAAEPSLPSTAKMPSTSTSEKRELDKHIGEEKRDEQSKKMKDHQSRYIHIEAAKLQLEEERIEIDRERLKIKRENLEINKRKLELLEEYIAMIRSKQAKEIAEDLFLSMVS